MSENGKTGSLEATSMPVYAWAKGGTTPPLLMNPEASWKVKSFTRVALSGVGAPRGVPMTATLARTGAVLDPSTVLQEAGLLPYDMIAFTPTDV